jgi:hypothetical protein
MSGSAWARRLGILPTAVLIFWGAAAPCAGQTLGLEFRVNTATSNVQTHPAVSGNGTGDFVIVWGSQTESGGSAYPVFGQRYAPSGAALGGPFAVALDTQLTYPAAAIALDASGGFVVVWVSPNQDGDHTGVYGRRFGGDGAPLTGEFRVNTYTTGYQGLPRVASSASNGFVVAWQSRGQFDGYNSTVFGQRYTSTGAPAGGEFRISASTTTDDSSPDVASDSAGHFVVTWFRTGGGLVARRYDTSGVPLGAEFPVSSGGDHPRVAAAPAGGFIVVWDIFNNVLSTGTIAAQRYSSAGAPLAARFMVSTQTNIDNDYPSVAFGSGGFAVVWSAGAVGMGSLGTRVRRYAASGTPIGSEFRVDTSFTSTSSLSSAIAPSKSDFVVAWTADDGSHDGIYARRVSGCLAGDVNGDGNVDVADVFYLINALFAGGPAPVCSGNVNGDMAVDVADVFYLINFLFAGGPAPL